MERINQTLLKLLAWLRAKEKRSWTRRLEKTNRPLKGVTWDDQTNKQAEPTRRDLLEPATMVAADEPTEPDAEEDEEIEVLTAPVHATRFETQATREARLTKPRRKLQHANGCKRLKKGADGRIPPGTNEGQRTQAGATPTGRSENADSGGWRHEFPAQDTVRGPGRAHTRGATAALGREEPDGVRQVEEPQGGTPRPSGVPGPREYSGFPTCKPREYQGLDEDAAFHHLLYRTEHSLQRQGSRTGLKMSPTPKMRSEEDGALRTRLRRKLAARRRKDAGGGGR